MTEKMKIYSIAKPNKRINVRKSVADQKRGYYAKRVTFSSGTP